MARYIIRKCPHCREYLAVAIAQPSSKGREFPITAHCEICGYQLKGWRLIVRREPPLDVRYARMPKVFKL